MEIKETIIRQALEAKSASYKLALLNDTQKNKILNAIADNLESNMDEILFKNEIDITAAKETELSNALIDRLTLTESRIKSMADGIRNITKLKDPIGEIIESNTTPNGLILNKVRVPLGVIAMIYESRPNVTVDSIALCIKSGNSIILRGGTEALNSNHALVKIVKETAYANGLPVGSIEFIETPDRHAIAELLKLNHLIDVVIPRGGSEMIETIISISKVPVIAHGKGICHTYVDELADLNMAYEISFNAKVNRPGVCNSMETLLIHKKIAEKFLPEMAKRFIDAKVELRACEKTMKILEKHKINAIPAKEEDWHTEYLDLILSIKIVENIDEAINHINKYGSQHSEAIVTNDKNNAGLFLKNIDASSVYHNASTRFTDGAEFGLGAEIGISTQKLHARGPMGIKELTSYKYEIHGNGQIRN
jgi:glutamate-5-semialdehyde dehydrogenase